MAANTHHSLISRQTSNLSFHEKQKQREEKLHKVKENITAIIEQKGKEIALMKMKKLEKHKKLTKQKSENQKKLQEKIQLKECRIFSRLLRFRPPLTSA